MAARSSATSLLPVSTAAANVDASSSSAMAGSARSEAVEGEVVEAVEREELIFGILNSRFGILNSRSM